MKYVEGQGGFSKPPQAGELLVCGRCGHLLAFRWHEGSEGLRLERMMWGEFQNLAVEVREGLAKVGLRAAQAAQGWEAPRWN